MDQVIKCACYLADIGTFAEFDAASVSFRRALPSRTIVEAGIDGIGVDIDAMA